MSLKSYWTECSSESDRSKEAIRSWFMPLAADMTPYKAEILCDIETDEEKKLRAFMRDASGQAYQLVRSRTARGFTLSMKKIGDQL